MAPMAIMGGLSLLTTGIKVASSIQNANAIREEAKATADALTYNAGVKEDYANELIQSTYEDERRLRVMARKSFGTLGAQIGASGLQMTGTAMMLLRESVANAEMDAQTIRTQGFSKAHRTFQDASMDRKKAAYAMEAGRRKASAVLMEGIAGGVLGGIGSMAGYMPGSSGGATEGAISTYTTGSAGNTYSGGYNFSRTA